MKVAIVFLPHFSLCTEEFLIFKSVLFFQMAYRPLRENSKRPFCDFLRGTFKRKTLLHYKYDSDFSYYRVCVNFCWF